MKPLSIQNSQKQSGFTPALKGCYVDLRNE